MKLCIYFLKLFVKVKLFLQHFQKKTKKTKHNIFNFL
jgi:hypothetical protein